MSFLKRFGGGSLVDQLPSEREFNQMLEENEKLLTKLNARVSMLDAEIDILAGRQLHEDKDKDKGDKND